MQTLMMKTNFEFWKTISTSIKLKKRLGHHGQNLKSRGHCLNYVPTWIRGFAAARQGRDIQKWNSGRRFGQTPFTKNWFWNFKLIRRMQFIASQIIHIDFDILNGFGGCSLLHKSYTKSQNVSIQVTRIHNLHLISNSALTLRRLFKLNLKCDADYEFEQPGLKTFNTRTENINSSRTSFQLDMTWQFRFEFEIWVRSL